ncbi:DNA primase [candidate division KSB1 bacterium]|nr:DNA primase [candidate division KSB1 bacterium]
MSIPQDKIEQVRLASDIVDVVSGYLTLQKRGKNFFGLCPFHNEKTPSFSVNPELQIFHCFGCGAGGNVFTFVMRMERLTFPETVRLLAKSAGILLPEEHEDASSLQEKEALYFANKLADEFFQKNLQQALEAEAARHYLQRRSLTPQACSTYGIGYSLNKWDGLLTYAAEKSLNTDILFKAGLVLKKESGDFYDRFRGRITFAIKNLSNQVIAFGARRIVEDKSPKYINSPETDVYQKRDVLYGLQLSREAVRQKSQVVIVEGYTDFIALHQAGITHVVATAGTSMTDEHARLLRRYTSNAIILYDSDSAGAAASLRGADILLTNGFDVRICLLPPGQDPDSFIRKNGLAAVQKSLAAAELLLDYRIRTLEEKGLLRTPSQKAESTRDLLASVAKIADPIQKAYVVRDLSDKLKMEEAVLWTEVRKLERRSRLQVKQEETDTSAIGGDFFASKRGAAELGLLEVSLSAPEMVSTIISALRPDELLHPELRDIFQKIELDHLEGISFDPQKYIVLVQDPFIAKRLSQMLHRKKKLITNPSRFCFDCLNAINIARLDKRIEDLRKRLQSDKEHARSLLIEYLDLVAERKRLGQIDLALE